MPLYNPVATSVDLTTHQASLSAHLAENLAYLSIDEHLQQIPTNSGWTAVVTGSGVTAQDISNNAVNTGVSVSSSALLRGTLRGIEGVGSLGAVTWGKKFYFFFGLSRITSDTEAVGRVQLKGVNTIGALASVGLGIRADNLALVGESYGTTLGEVDLATSLVDGTAKWITIVYDPAVPNVKWYVNGVLKGTQSTAAKTPNGLTAIDSFIVSSIAKNAATTTGNAYLILLVPQTAIAQ